MLTLHSPQPTAPAGSAWHSDGITTRYAGFGQTPPAAPRGRAQGTVMIACPGASGSLPGAYLPVQPLQLGSAGGTGLRGGGQQQLRISQQRARPAQVPPQPLLHVEVAVADLEGEEQPEGAPCGARASVPSQSHPQAHPT